MPAIPVTYRPQDRAINELGDQERSQRQTTIDRAWAYRDGNFAPPLRVEPGQRDDNILLNLCGQMIDDKVSFIGVPDRIEIPGGVDRVRSDSGELQAAISPVQALVNRFWAVNDLSTFVPDVLESGMVSGHAFMRLHHDAALPDTPLVSLLDPRWVTVFWDASSPRRTLFYRLDWQQGNRAMRQDIVPAWLLNLNDDESAPRFDTSGGWVMIEYQQRGSGWEEVLRESWPYPFAPIVQVKNKHRPHAYYGVDDLRHARLNDAVNFVASNTGRILKFHAHPKTIITGADLNQIEATAVDQLWSIPNPEAQVQNLEMQSDLASSMGMLDFLSAAFYRESRLVDLSSIKDRIGQLTNFGLRTLYSDQIDDAQAKRRVYGTGIAEVTRRALWMMGVAIDAAPRPIWPDLLPVDRRELVATLTAEQALGIASRQTIAEDLGRDPLAEGERIAEEG